MVKFEDGPLAGSTPGLRRTPLFLRAVVNGAGEVDALDLPEDTPKDDEKVTVYKREGATFPVHVKAAKKHGGGWYAKATYKVLPEQPGDGATRDTQAWRAWAKRQDGKGEERYD